MTGGMVRPECCPALADAKSAVRSLGWAPVVRISEDQPLGSSEKPEVPPFRPDVVLIGYIEKVEKHPSLRRDGESRSGGK